MLAFEQLPPGFRLLCLALQSNQSQHRPLIEATIGEVDDWRKFITSAKNHHLIPPVATMLRSLSTPQLPSWVQPELKEAHARQALLCLKQMSAMARLCTAMAAEGIRCLTVKGTTLSQLLFNDPVWRGYGDVDLLVDPAKFLDAQATLQRHGYIPMLPWGTPVDTPSPSREFLRDLDFHHPDGHRVELHQRLTEDPTLLPFEFDVLWRDRRGIPGFPPSVQTLSAEHCALYLVIHGAEHAWGRLRWLGDFQSVFADLHFREQILAAAAALSLKPAVMEAIALSQFLFEQQPLEQVGPSERHAIERYYRWFVCKNAWSRPSSGHALPGRALICYSLRIRWYQYTLRRTWSGAWRRFRAELLAPVDWHLFNLPKSLRWLYPPLRPLGWFLRRTLPVITAGRKHKALRDEAGESHKSE